MLTVSLRTVPGLNAREHWAQRSKRVKAEREAVAWSLRSLPRPALPAIVTLTRVGPSNGLDDDNLAGALKGVRDEIAEWLGVNDRDRKTVRYEYEQRRGKEWAVEIAIRPMLSVDDALRVVGAV